MHTLFFSKLCTYRFVPAKASLNLQNTHIHTHTHNSRHLGYIYNPCYLFLTPKLHTQYLRVQRERKRIVRNSTSSIYSVHLSLHTIYCLSIPLSFSFSLTLPLQYSTAYRSYNQFCFFPPRKNRNLKHEQNLSSRYLLDSLARSLACSYA